MLEMDKFESVDDILEFAIAGEVAANQFYMELAGKMENPALLKEDTDRNRDCHTDSLNPMPSIPFMRQKIVTAPIK